MDQKAKVLIVSDEFSMADIWGFSLEKVGLDVCMANVDENILQVFDKELPDLIIIEDFNDKFEELEICRQLRLVTVVPILYLTSKVGENFLLETYAAGADESIPYPITPRLFQAKVMTWLRRTRDFLSASIDEIRVAGFLLDPSHKRLMLPSGQQVKLTLLETRLLYVLMSHAERQVPVEELIEKVWGYHNPVERKLIKNHIYRLRQKIEADPRHPRFLLNVGYKGYKFHSESS